MFELSTSQFIINNLLVIPSYTVGKVLGRIYLPSRSQLRALDSLACCGERFQRQTAARFN